MSQRCVQTQEITAIDVDKQPDSWLAVETTEA